MRDTNHWTMGTWSVNKYYRNKLSDQSNRRWRWRYSLLTSVQAGLYSSLMSDQTDPNHRWPRYCRILLFVSVQFLFSHFWRIQFPLNVAVTSLCHWNSYLCNIIQEITIVRARDVDYKTNYIHHDALRSNYSFQRALDINSEHLSLSV